MKIGLTYDLRDDYKLEGLSEEEVVELDTPETINGLESAIQKIGYKTERIGGIKNLVKKLANNERWDLVFNICEGIYGFGREAQVPALLDAYKIPYTFSDPLVLSLTLHKGITKELIKSICIKTAPFFVLNNLNDLVKIDLPFPQFVKPVAEGTSKGIFDFSLVNNKNELEDTCMKLLKKYNQPLIIEKYLSGKEYTVGMIGTGENSTPIGVLEVEINKEIQCKFYSYTNKK